MKSNIINLFLYNKKIYIICNNKVDIIGAEKVIIKEGRINNLTSFIKCLKESLIIKKSSLKLVDDIINIVYFGNYNDEELNNITNRFRNIGYEKIKLIPLKDILDNSYNYLLFNNEYYVLIEDNCSYIIHPKFWDNMFLNKDKTYLMDEFSYQDNNQNCYIISDLPKYLIGFINRRNK